MSAVPAASQRSPDIEETQQFLAALGDRTFCFQSFDDRSQNRRLARTLHGSLDEYSAVLTHLNNQGAGIFVTVNEVTLGERRFAKNVTRVRALFVDADKPELVPEIEQRIARLGLLPSIVVESSPGKRHYYWRVDDCPVEAFKATQQRLAHLLGTDPSVNDPSRVMRLPGFFHHKGAPFCTRVVSVR